MGALKAQELGAANRLGELETLIKGQVDSGQLPAFRAPAFERGFRARVGSELAKTGFQEDLMGQLADASRVTSTVDDNNTPQTHAQRLEKLIGDTYSKYSSRIQGSDIYAKQAFDETAQAVISGFRARAIDTYSAQFEAAGKQKIADDLTERTYALAEAPEANVGALTANLKEGLDYARAHDLSAAEARPFFLKESVAPAVSRLISERKYDKALTLIDRVGAMDLTGKGGLLGKTADGDILNRLQEHVLTEQRQNLNIEWDRVSGAAKLTNYHGEQAAIADLQKMRDDHGGVLDPAKQLDMVNAFAAAHQGHPDLIDSYRQTVSSQYAHEEKNLYDPKLAATLIVSADTLDPKAIESTKHAAETAFAAGTLSPEAYTGVIAKLNEGVALHGLTSERDYEHLRVNLYAQGEKRDQIDFGAADDAKKLDDPSRVDRMWDKLPPALRVQHEQDTADFFGRAYAEKIRGLGNKTAATSEALVKARAEATVESRAFAVSRLRTMTSDRVKKEAEAQAAKQAQVRREVALVRGFDVTPSLIGAALPTGKDKPFFGMAPAAGQFGPAPEADSATVYIPATGWGEFLLPGLNGKSSIVNLPDLVKDMAENPNADKASRSKQIYGYVKSRLGFTPDEIKDGATKHGVPFSPSDIDPNFISVFRSRTELEKHWANGKPDETFMAVGHAVDPQDRLTTEQFYRAQLALFSHK